jgi:hypothetical protein
VESVLGKAVTSNLHFLYKNINKLITQEHLVRACSLTQDKIIYTLENNEKNLKLNTNWKIVKTMLSMILMTLGFTLISLYVPIKGLISGKVIRLSNFYLELRYTAIIIAVSIAMNTKI